jgi:hypothetical protein
MGQLLYVLPLGHKLKYGATRMADRTGLWSGRTRCVCCASSWRRVFCDDTWKKIRAEAELRNHG